MLQTKEFKMSENLYDALIDQREGVSIIGRGYVGLPIAAAFSKKWMLREYWIVQNMKNQDIIIGGYNRRNDRWDMTV